MDQNHSKMIRSELEKICSAPLKERLSEFYSQSIPDQEKTALTLAFTHGNLIIMLFRSNILSAQSFCSILRAFCKANNIDWNLIEHINVDLFTHLTDLMMKKFQGDLDALSECTFVLSQIAHDCFDVLSDPKNSSF